MVIPLRDTAPRSELPLVTWSLIGVNVVVYLVELLAPGGPLAVIDAWGLQPARIWAGENLTVVALPATVTLLTSTFLHFSLLHLLGNMLMLWLLGDAVEWLCGRWRFLALYLFTGVIAAFATAALGGDSKLAGAGASGAIAGVMGGYLYMFPRARIVCWIGWFEGFFARTYMRRISAVWFIGFWVIEQVLLSIYAIGAQEAGPLGVYAHTSGAAIGVLLIILLRDPYRLPPPELTWRETPEAAKLLGYSDATGDFLTDAQADEAVRKRQRSEAQSAAFSDKPVRALLAQGDVLGARALCEEMLAQSQVDQNFRRIEGYRSLLREIEAKRTGADQTPNPWSRP